jgi:hypothetical protein
MAAFGEFVSRLLNEGRIVFDATHPPADNPTDRDVAALAEAFAAHALAVADTPIAFDPRAACQAAELVRQASWALVDHRERPEALRRRLRITPDPSTPSQHLSADLCLRYLPQVLMRARALDPADPLLAILADVLRRWPLSGVLSDVEEPPLVAPDLAGHPGLLLLYAERLAANDRRAWRPDPLSAAYEYQELLQDTRNPRLATAPVPPP